MVSVNLYLNFMKTRSGSKWAFKLKGAVLQVYLLTHVD